MISKIILLFIIPVYSITNIIVKIDNLYRNTPLIGSGNELVWQNVSDDLLISSTIKLKNFLVPWFSYINFTL